MFRRRVLVQLLKIADLIIFALAIDFSIRSTQAGFTGLWPASLDSLLNTHFSVYHIVVFALCLLIWNRLLSSFGVYQSRRLSTLRHYLLDLLKATTAACLTITLILGLATDLVINVQFVVFFWSTSTLTIIFSRFCMRFLLNQLRRMGRNKRKLLIVGTNNHAIRFSNEINHCLELGYILLGFVDKKTGATLERTGGQLVADFDSLPDYLCETPVDEVAIFYPLRSHYDEIQKIVDICEKHGILVRLRTNMFELSLGRSFVEQVMGESLVTIYTGNMHYQGWKIIMKHAFDFHAALLLLLLLSPLLLTVAILIKLDSPGPVLFSQLRVGQNKARFRMFKFRTMAVDAEQRIAELEAANEADGPVFKIKNDPRITKLGKWLRKTSIDELPQLFNVLLGEMSLVGPRPLPERDYNLFADHSHRRRFSVRPGITGLWQISGRSDIAFDQWMKLDMEYIDRWSLMLDLKILMRTASSVIKGSGAA